MDGIGLTGARTTAAVLLAASLVFANLISIQSIATSQASPGVPLIKWAEAVCDTPLVPNTTWGANPNANGYPPTCTKFNDRYPTNEYSVYVEFANYSDPDRLRADLAKFDNLVRLLAWGMYIAPDKDFFWLVMAYGGFGNDRPTKAQIRNGYESLQPLVPFGVKIIEKAT